MIDKVFHLLTHDYSLILATKTEHFNAVKAIRNDVIVNHYPSVNESKEYIFSQDDKQSFLYLLRHNQTQRYIGSVRIFFANNRTPVKTVPMEKDLHIKNIENLTNQLPICEVSRFALVHDQVPHEEFSELHLRTYLSLTLMCATRINFLLYDYNKMFAIMEKSLHRILKRQGVLFSSIGDAIDFHGKRFPFVINKEDLSNAIVNTEGTMGDLTIYYLKELCQNIKSFWEFIDNNPYLNRSDIQLDCFCNLFKLHGEETSLSMLLAERFPDENS
jgi:N-acyl amino acid synthase of PEP-CTERM/exosortase system